MRRRIVNGEPLGAFSSYHADDLFLHGPHLGLEELSHLRWQEIR